MAIISNLCTRIQKSSECSRLCASCDEKGAGCTTQYAAVTFDLQQVSDGVHSCVQVVTKYLIFIDAGHRRSQGAQWVHLHPPGR